MFLTKFAVNVLLVGVFLESRAQFLREARETAGLFQAIQYFYCEFWTISLIFAGFLGESARKSRYLLLFLEYCYFKYRLLGVFSLESDFFFENLYVFLSFQAIYRLEARIREKFSQIKEELDNLQLLSQISELSNEGVALFNDKCQVLYASAAFLQSFSQENCNNSLIFEETRKDCKKLELSELKNPRIFTEFEDIRDETPKSQTTQAETQDKSPNLLQKPATFSNILAESHVLINEKSDSEENLLVKLSNLQKKKTSAFQRKQDEFRENSHKPVICFQETVKSLLKDASFSKESDFSSVLDGLAQRKSEIELFLQRKSLGNLEFLPRKPGIFFFREEKAQQSYAVIFIPLKIAGKSSVFVIIRGLLQEIYGYYAAKIEKFQESFMRTMSHELRTPINGSLALLQEFSEKFQANSQIMEVLGPAISNLRIFHNTVNDIFDFSKLFLKKFALKPAPFRLKTFVKELVALMRPLFERKSVELRYKIAETLPFLLVSDSARVRQILLNLLTNSLRFTNSGGVVLVSVEIEGFAAKFTVKDTGVGISVSKMKNLLRLSLENEGTMGFGLTVSDFLAKELNSERKGLFIESETGKGCCVSFFVSSLGELQGNSPGFAGKLEEFEGNSKKKQETVRKSLENLCLETKFLDFIKKKNSLQQEIVEKSFEKNTKKTVEGKALKKTCKCADILIVDDNEFNLIALKFLLEKKNFIVEQARNGQEAIEKIEEKLHAFEHACLYKLVFMDLDMPVKNGFETCDELTVIFSNFDVKIPIIACTAFEENIREKCEKHGMNEFLTKPVSNQELDEVLGSHFSYC